LNDNLSAPVSSLHIAKRCHARLSGQAGGTVSVNVCSQPTDPGTGPGMAELFVLDGDWG